MKRKHFDKFDFYLGLFVLKYINKLKSGIILCCITSDYLYDNKLLSFKFINVFENYIIMFVVNQLILK